MRNARLRVTDATGSRVVAVGIPVFSMGRRGTSDLSITAPEVSREHAEIHAVEDVYHLRDRGSRFGTFVNGSPVTEHVLTHGDLITLGRGQDAEIVFLLDADVTDAGSGVSNIVGTFRQISSLLDSLRALGGARLLDDVLALVTDAAIEVTGAERGFIMLAGANGELELKLARARGKVSLSGSSPDTSRRIPERVFATGQGQIVQDLLDAGVAGLHDGTIALGIRHVLCVPLRLVRYLDRASDSWTETRSIGVLYLDSRQKGTLLSDTARVALDTVAVEAAVAIENARLYRETIEKARIEEELKIAAQIQQALLPPSHKAAAFFAAEASSVPCRAVGGDFFDYFDMPDGGFSFVLGDVAGKGTPAALLAAVLQGIFAGQAFAATDAGDTMARVNRGLCGRAATARFATAFFGTLTPDGRLAYCNAGHNPPFVFSKAGVGRLEEGGTVLGLFKTAAYEYGVVQLGPDDTVVLFSDGVSEALSVADEEFGDERLRAAVEAALAQSPDGILTALLAAVRQFVSGAAQNDDITAMVIRYGATGVRSGG